MQAGVVILNWNGADLLRKFLPSVVAYTPKTATIYVADNGSTDNSVEILNREFPRVKLILNQNNLGFAEGYNKALKQVEENIVVLLNSDVEVTFGWLEPLVTRVASNDKVAACQPKILAYNQKDYFEYAGAAGGFIDALGYPYCRGRMFDHLEKDEGQYQNPIEIFWATGTCICVRKDAYFEVGGLDGDFFAHMEEIDLCWRLHRAGYQVWAEPSATIFHVGGGTLDAANPKKTFLNFRNGLAMITKNVTLSKLIWIIPARLVLDGIAGLKFLADGKADHMWAVIKAHFSFYLTFAKWFYKREGNFGSLKVITQKSVVWSFFVKGIKEFGKLS